MYVPGFSQPSFERAVTLLDDLNVEINDGDVSILVVRHGVFGKSALSIMMFEAPFVFIIS